MKIKKFLKLALVAAFAATVIGCDDDVAQPVANNNADITLIPPAAVYTMTNDPGANAIREYRRAATGELAFVKDYPTGASGSGDNLNGASGSLIHVHGTNRFFNVNAGSNSVTFMSLGGDGALTAMSTANSGGTRPISVTTFGTTVYVLNAGDPINNIPANISGLELVGTQLVPIAGSTQTLSVANPNPAQIAFHPAGTVLVVTERDSNRITTFVMNGNVAGPPKAQVSSAITPSGFDYTALGTMITAGATNGAAGSASVSSHIVAANGDIAAVTAALGNNQSAATSVEVSKVSAHAYVANAGTNNLSIVNIDGQNGLSLQGNGNSIGTGLTPADLEISEDGLFLYVLNTGDDSISAYRVGADGSLSGIPGMSGLPVNSVGLVAR